MKHSIKILFIFSIIIGLLTRCSDDSLEPNKTKAPKLTQKVNLFIKDAMSDIYLWNDKLPDIDYRYETNPVEYFQKLKYKEDKWSYITDDIVALENSFKGIEKSYGWSLAFYYLSKKKEEVIAVVEYVYPKTPAANAGIKRGDIIIALNGNGINDKNFRELLSGENITVTRGEIEADDQENISLIPGSSFNLTAKDLNLNPVLETNVVEYGGHKIGYLFYAQYLDNYINAIDTALQNLIDKNITDLILDLRYNPGGSISAARHLCSALAPLSVVNAKSKLVSFQWNESYQKYWISKQKTSQVQVNFNDSVEVKMGLDHIHILTGKATASASELTITGLSPYMAVTTVGDTTYGKYTGSITLKPEAFYAEKPDYYKEIDNWGLQPIVLRYANAWGVTDFKDGFAPDIRVSDNTAYPLGDLDDPLFAAAIEDITGSVIAAATKSAKKPIISTPAFYRGFSKFDKNKRELLVKPPLKDINEF